MSIPKVSVIIPVYGVEAYLDRCVQSVLRQTLRDIEIILVDDGSPDRCPAMCDDYARRYPNVRVVHKANAGLGMACNSGLEVATGEYVAFLDSDDWVDSEMYATMYAAAVEAYAQMVFTGLKRVDSTGKCIGTLPHRSSVELYRDGDVMRLMIDLIASTPECRIDRTIQVSAKVVMYNRAFLENNGLRFVSERQYLSEDMLFNVMSLLKCSAAIVLPNVFYNYFVNNNSITTTVRPDYIKYLDRTIERLKSLADDVEDFEMRKSMLLRIDRYIIGETRSYMKHIFRSTLKRCDKVALLDDMLRRKYMKEVVRIYPRRKMPMMHRIVFELFIHRCYSVLGVLFKAKL